MNNRYFILGKVSGSPFTRYATLTGSCTVTEITVSRPDGIEVPKPASFRLRVQPYFGGEVRRRWFNNVPPRNAERRSLMLTTTDEKLEHARERGKFRRAAA